MSRGWSQFTISVCTTSRMIATGTADAPAKSAAPRIGGTSASGGPKNGMSMSSALVVASRKRYGMPKIVPTTATSRPWTTARISWARRKPPNARTVVRSKRSDSSRYWRGTADRRRGRIRFESISM